MQTAKAVTTRPVLSVALYACFKSSGNASPPITNAPPVAASNILPLLLGCVADFVLAAFVEYLMLCRKLRN